MQKHFMDQPVSAKSFHPKGYVTLMAILLLSMVGTTLAVSLLVLSSDSSRTALTLVQSTQARVLADTCVEVALQQIRTNNSFTGTATTTFSADSVCTFTITSQGGQNRTIQSTGTIKNVVRRVQVLVGRINPTFTITSWEEKANFN